jgi:hypothetical protein
VYQWCEFKSRQGKNKNLIAQKSNSNTVWFNLQTYIYIITPYIHVQCMYAWYWLVDISCICHVFSYFKWISSIFPTTGVFAWYYYHMKICISLQQFDQTIYEGVIALFHQKHCMCSFYILNGNSSENYILAYYHMKNLLFLAHLAKDNVSFCHHLWYVVR